MQHEATEVATDAELLDPGKIQTAEASPAIRGVKKGGQWSNGHGNCDNIYTLW